VTIFVTVWFNYRRESALETGPAILHDPDDDNNDNDDEDPLQHPLTIALPHSSFHDVSAAEEYSPDV
jgi:hypothetical protein